MADTRLATEPEPSTCFQGPGARRERVLADAAAAIPGALSRVPENKRPALNPALFDAYARWYPGWTFALRCFDSREAGKAHPLVWWYEPLDENRLILPALDCHTGDVPNLNARVTIDHVIAVGSTRMSNRAASSARHVHLGKLPTAAQPFFVNRVVGERLDRGRTMPNGDFVVALDDVRNGRFDLRRERPPGA